MSIALRRMQREVQDLRSEEVATSLRQSGILVHAGDDNIFCVRAMMIGPPDTPYAGGFFCFEFQVDPAEYPNKPPKGKFLTTDGRVRFNPNLYACGKICLSVLNTWSGPAWTPMMRVSSVLLCLQGFVFTDAPVKNEPSYYACKDKKEIQAYNDYVRYNTWRLAICGVLTRGLPSGFECFEEEVFRHVRANLDTYQHAIDTHVQSVALTNCVCTSRYMGGRGGASDTAYHWQDQWNRFKAWRDVDASPSTSA